MTTKGLRTWIEIDTSAIAANYAALRKRSPRIKLMGVVKSNAYGHGLVAFSRELEKLGIDALAVDSVVEGLRLRQEGIKAPILVLGYTLPELVAQAAENDISLTISTFELLDVCAVLPANLKIKIHLKVDTGLHRQGFMKEQMAEVFGRIARLQANVEFEGLFTHFAKAKDPAYRAYTEGQLVEFKQWIQAVHEAGFKPVIHACATAGMLLYPEAHFDMVRVGAGFYGIMPSQETGLAVRNELELKAALSWRTIIGERKELPKGVSIGYNLTDVLTRNSVIAICPVGYWHGFAWALSSMGEVLVNGKRAKVLGRVSMDMITIDITDIPDARVGSVVTLIGADGSEKISAGDMTAKIGPTTYEYEILTRLNPLIERIYQ